MSSLARLVLIVIPVLALGLAPARANAGTPDVRSIASAAGYAVPVGCSVVTGTYHVAYMLYDEGAPRRWRTAAYVCGGISVGLGAYLLSTSDDSGATGLTIGVLPIVLGTYAIATAWFVGAPDDIVGPMAHAPSVTPWFSADAAGLAWSGSF